MFIQQNTLSLHFLLLFIYFLTESKSLFFEISLDVSYFGLVLSYLDIDRFDLRVSIDDLFLEKAKLLFILLPDIFYFRYVVILQLFHLNTFKCKVIESLDFAGSFCLDWVL